VLDSATAWTTRLDEVHKTLDLWRSRGQKNAVGEFLRFLSAFIILRQAEVLENEQEAIASFDNASYEPRLPRAVRWSRVAEAPVHELSNLLREVWAGLAELPATPETKHLRQIPAVFSPTWAEPAGLIEPARRLVADSNFESTQGRRELADLFESVVAAHLRAERYAGEFSTPNHLADFLVNLAQPKLGERIYDPCFGLGGLLAEAARRIMERAEALTPADWKQAQERSIFGVEIHPSAWLVGLARVILAGVRSPNLELGNTLERPMPRDRSAEGFDCILANIPFGGADPAHAEQFRVKTAARDSNFLQHILGHLRLGGRAVILVPESILFRQGADELIRRQMLEEFHVDAVISLPAGWLEHTKVKSSILCVSRREPAKEVLFVGEQIWEEGIEGRARHGHRSEVFYELIHRRQGLIPTPPQSVEHLDRATTEAFFRDAFDEFNPKLGMVTPSGDPERMREYVERLDLIRQLPGAQETDAQTAQNLLRLPELHGVRLAWTVPVARLAARHWELVAKETGEAALEEFLQKLQRRGGPVRRVTLADIAEVFTGVGYDKSGTVEQDFSKIESVAGAIGLVPLVRVQDVGGEKSERSSTTVRHPSMFLNEKGMERVREYHRLRVGDLLLTASGTVGNLGLVSEFLAGAVPAKSLIVIRLKGAFKPLALFRLLQSAPYQDWIRGAASGNIIRHLSVRVVRQMPLLALPAEQQERLAQHLREGEDAEAVLQAFSALTGESLWISLLLNDSEIRYLVGGRHSEAYTAEWWRTLSGLVRRGEYWTAHGASRSRPDSFLQCLVLWRQFALNLLDAMELPPGLERYASIKAWESGARTQLTDAKDDLKRRSREDETAARAAEQFAALCEVLLDAADVAAREVAQAVSLQAELPNPIVDAGRAGEVEVVVTNLGRAPLRKVRLRLEPLGVVRELSLLGGGESQRWAVPIPAQTAGPIPLVLRWDGVLIDGRAASGELELAIEARSLRVAATAELFDQNPYVTGSPVSSADQFFGREDVIRQIRRLLRTQGPSSVILLEGNRRAGKTSILYRLREPGVLPDWLPVYRSFQGISGDPKVAGFAAQDLFRDLASGILEAVDRSGTGTEPLSPAERLARKRAVSAQADAIGQDRPFEQFRAILEACLDRIQPKRMLLMLDEFDKLQEAIDNGVLSPQVPENLRFLFHTYDSLSAILTGSRRIKRLREEYWSVLFGIGKSVGVSKLDQASARRLVTHPVAGRLVYANSALERALALTACQPFLLQNLASEVFQLCAERAQRSVTTATVDEAAERMVRDFEHFQSLFKDQLTTDRQRFLLCLIHRLVEGPDRVTFELIRDELERHGVRYSSGSALRSDLDELRELETVALDDGAYRLEVPLLSLWLRQSVDWSSYLEPAQRTEG
jgi:type I restriction enzyme M protein